MASLSDFAKDFKPKDKVVANEEKIKEDIKDKYEQYKDFNEDQLLSELYKQIELQKLRGEFDYDALKTNVEFMSNYLNDEQKQKLFKLLEHLKWWDKI